LKFHTIGVYGRVFQNGYLIKERCPGRLDW